MGQQQPVKARPLSPHLQIYKPMLTMMMSIFHRLTGVGLYFGALVFTWWLMAAASGPEYYNWVMDLLATLPGMLVLILVSWAFFHHMLGGIRHFIWDFGKGFELATVEMMAWVNLVGAIVLTALFWLFI
ncbi:MAG: succinate dehydrogenase membrane anchor subunit [Rhodomicrobium sp.]|nr:MAG: succinate dehydrogenase membrane anchor subunit [Rhodomicrobium sp.]